MKLLRRILVVTATVLAVLVVVLLLYLGFADLSRHKALIERLVTNKTGRALTLGEPFELEVFPRPSVVATDIRFANAEWSSVPAMVEIGRLAVEVDLWSLIRPPIQVPTLDLEGVEILLEKSTEGESNWVLGEDEEPEPEPEPSDDHRPPAVIEDGHISDLRLVYREPDREDRIVALDRLDISPAESGLLAVDGSGWLNKYPLTVRGDLGPLPALRSGRDIRVAIEATAGNLEVGAHGAIGSLNPLDGADLTLTAANPDVALMFENLGLPAFAVGAMDAEARLSDAGDRTGLDFEATVGDIHARTTGSFRRVGLAESDLSFEVSVGDAARLAEVFEVADVAAEELKARGHVSASRTAATLDGFAVEFAGAEAGLDGTVRLSGVRGSDLRFEARAGSLADLQSGLPAVPLEASGRYARHQGVLEVSELQVHAGDSDLSGTLSVRRGDGMSLEADLASQRIDLAQLTGRDQQEESDSPTTSGETAPEEETAKEAPKKEFVFGEEPLPLGKLTRTDGRLGLEIAELAFHSGVMRDVDVNLTIEDGSLELATTALGGVEGTLDCSVQMTPTAEAADLVVRLDAVDFRSGLLAGEGDEAADDPAINLEIDLKAGGASPHEMAAGANGHVLVSQGSGMVRSGLVEMFGAGLLAQLASRLNPFAAEDPQTELECTVARVDVIDGQATIAPVLMQTEKVTVTAHGKVDLHTEDLTFDFNTRPRKGIGISAGMFTNPFIKVGGTLAHPALATGAEGVASGGLAAVTGGISVLAKGLMDRLAGEADRCQKVLDEARSGPSKAALKLEEKADKSEPPDNSE